MKFRKIALSLVIAGLAFGGFSCETDQSGRKEQTTAAQTPVEPVEHKSAAQAQPEAEQDPSIEFSKVVHDFGQIGPGSRNVCSFEFKNAGQSELKIKRVTKTCGCTPFTLAKKEYAPGETGTLKVSYHAGSRAGRSTKRLYVFSNDPVNPKVPITIQARIIEKVVHEPKRLKLVLNKENAGCPPIKIESVDKQPFAITSFKSTANAVTADIDKTRESTEFVIEPTVNEERLRSDLNGVVSINLTHPEAETIRIPFTTLPVYEINPSSVNILNAEPGKKTTRDLWILNNYEKDFQLDSVSSENGMVEVVSREKLEKRYHLKLEVTPPQRQQKSFFSDTLTINLEDGEELSVRVRGFYAKD